MPVFFPEEQQCIQVEEMAAARAWLGESEMICYWLFFFYPCLFYCGSFGWASIEGGEVGVMSVFSHSPFLQAGLGRISRIPVLKVIVGSF